MEECYLSAWRHGFYSGLPGTRPSDVTSWSASRCGWAHRKQPWTRRRGWPFPRTDKPLEWRRGWIYTAPEDTEFKTWTLLHTNPHFAPGLKHRQTIKHTDTHTHNVSWGEHEQRVTPNKSEHADTPGGWRLMDEMRWWLSSFVFFLLHSVLVIKSIFLALSSP